MWTVLCVWGCKTPLILSKPPANCRWQVKNGTSRISWKWCKTFTNSKPTLQQTPSSWDWGHAFRCQEGHAQLPGDVSPLSLSLMIPLMTGLKLMTSKPQKPSSFFTLLMGHCPCRLPQLAHRPRGAPSPRQWCDFRPGSFFHKGQYVTCDTVAKSKFIKFDPLHHRMNHFHTVSRKGCWVHELFKPVSVYFQVFPKA